MSTSQALLRDARRLRVRLLLGAAAGFVTAGPLTAVVLLIRGGWGPLRRLDHDVAQRLHDAVAPRPGLVRALDVIAVVAQPYVFRAAVAALVAVLVWRRAYRLAWWAGVTMIAGSLLGFLLKLVVARVRPNLPDALAHASGYSFPSGHALNSAVGVAVLLGVTLPLLKRRRTKLAAYLGAGAAVLLVGFDRIALGVHYTSDVVGGWLIAFALVTATTAAFEIWRYDTGRRMVDPLVEGVDPDESARLT
jgi:membrane-associated phospholipid phosphatase